MMRALCLCGLLLAISGCGETRQVREPDLVVQSERRFPR